MRANLNIKVVVNASPFYYGAMMVCYKPLRDHFASAPIRDAGPLQFDNVSFSQLPRIYVYPQNSQGGEMKLPFVYHKEWLRLTSINEVREMGTLFLRPMTALYNANGVATGAINIQVYAYASEVNLTGPTYSVALQGDVSGEDDEYGQGKVSGPASAVARAAGMLAAVPTIGPFALATSIGATAVSKIASLFGYTNVPVIEDPRDMTPTPFPHLAATDIGVPMEKFCLDSKNELTIDPKALGVDTGDELLIKNICMRESYLCQFDWQQSDTVDTRKFAIEIAPTLMRIDGNAIAMTPIAWLAKLYRYWRGDINIRMKFICSQYHRGRVIISWDPNGNAAEQLDSTAEVYSKIVDISECTDITFNVPYIQNTAYLKCTDELEEKYSLTSTGGVTHQPGVTNGILSVRVLTDLTSPIATSTVPVLVFVSGGENFELSVPSDFEFAENEPSDNKVMLSPFPIPPGPGGLQGKSSALTVGYVSPIITDHGNEPQIKGETQIELQGDIVQYDDNDKEVNTFSSGTTQTSDNINLLYIGEANMSLRTLLRRHVFYRFQPTLEGIGAEQHYMVNIAERRMNLYPGYDPNGIDLASNLNDAAGASVPFNFVNWTPLSWISMCYLGARGSVNYQINLTTAYPWTSTLRASRNAQNLESMPANYATITTGNIDSKRQYLFSPESVTGMSLTNTRTNTSLRVQVPFFANTKFRLTSPYFIAQGSANDNCSKFDYFWISFSYTPKYGFAENNHYNNNLGYELYSGAGTDYTPFFFLNVPTLYKYDSTPSARLS